MESTTRRPDPLEGVNDPIAHGLILNIRRAIERRGTTKTAVARLINMPTVTFNRKLAGKSDWHVGEVYDIADALGLDAKLDLLPPTPALERAA